MSQQDGRTLLAVVYGVADRLLEGYGKPRRIRSVQFFGSAKMGQVLVPKWDK